MKSLKKLLTTTVLGLALGFGVYTLPTVVNIPTVYAADTYICNTDEGNGLVFITRILRGGDQALVDVKTVYGSGKPDIGRFNYIKYSDGSVYYRYSNNFINNPDEWFPIENNNEAAYIYYHAVA